MADMQVQVPQVPRPGMDGQVRLKSHDWRLARARAPRGGLEQEWKWERSEDAKAHDATLKTGKRGLLHPAA